MSSDSDVSDTAPPAPACTSEPAATGQAAPRAGSIQRIAAEMLDALADHVAEQPAEAGLTDLLARHAQCAAEAHQIPRENWFLDGIETIALLGLAMAALPLPRSETRREQLAARFAQMPADQQRTWLIEAADVLHPDSLAGCCSPQTQPQAQGAALRPDACAPQEPASAEHGIAQGLYIQLLPACLAPCLTDRDAHPELGLPEEGDAVVVARGQVMFLAADKGTSHFAVETTQLWGAPLIGEGCGAARWDPDSVTALDASYPGLEDADAEAIYTAWHLLIDLANQFTKRGGPR